ncbi:MAG: bifunctional 2-polyprenyl-6-hydroxyphenol methylase/3-demethylubiquinol 3-O-methyltransferase UbiG [Hyphomicrobiales bacterium]|nr:bifunctional 2-polyprenyl-6-hydroxyphenol methylase/3-demethylubiquinol 3-O-methyltransferase UbiG [Hyphomicrobiales bacterium]
MNSQSSILQDSTLDAAEVERFAAMAAEWWDPKGKFAPLHALNPTRLTFIRDQLCSRFDRSARDANSLSGLQIADIGCGGGLLCEPLTRLGASVTGLDPAAETIKAAKAHASAQGLEIDYRAGRVEALAEAGLRFDAVLAMEVVEHVPDVTVFVRLVGDLVRPGGLLILSTINRTLKSWALAIVGAEYVLRWLPVGTHQWDRFVTPGELSRAAASAGLGEIGRRGMIFNPLRGNWTLAADTDVNYLLAAGRAD